MRDLTGWTRAAAFSALTLTVLVAGCSASGSEETAGARSEIVVDTPLIAVETSLGTMVIELYPWEAPATVENFIGYVNDRFYDGLVFHRVISEFIIQAGGYDSLLQQRPAGVAIPNEADNGLRNVRGAVAMARYADPHTATSQFYINVFDNRQLDPDQTANGWGYAVFGRVRSGIDVVDSISMVKTGIVAGMPDVPIAPIVIDSIRLIEE